MDETAKLCETPADRLRQDKSASPRRGIGGRKFLCSLIAAWHCSRPAVLSASERPESSKSRMAPIAAWRTGSQNWDRLRHERMEGRCRSGDLSRLAPSARPAEPAHGLDWAQLARLFGFHALIASCERGRSLDEEEYQGLVRTSCCKPSVTGGISTRRRR